MVDNILVLSPKISNNSKKVILISHGSGGLGNTEYNVADFFLTRGYTVILHDYFLKANIKELYWDEGDITEIYLKSLIHDLKFDFDYDIVHIGFSLGGYLGLVHANQFYKNFCFYPGILGFTKQQLEQDYTNTTVFIPTKDNWCTNYYDFANLCRIKPNEIIIDKKYHGFMSVGKNKKFSVLKYDIDNVLLSKSDLENFQISYPWLSLRYDYKKLKIRLKFDQKSFIMCLTYIIGNIE